MRNESQIHAKAYTSVSHAKADIAEYFHWYHAERGHSSLNKQTPDEAYQIFNTIKISAWQYFKIP